MTARESCALSLTSIALAEFAASQYAMSVGAYFAAIA